MQRFAILVENQGSKNIEATMTNFIKWTISQIDNAVCDYPD